jgi:hypothetical protein
VCLCTVGRCCIARTLYTRVVVDVIAVCVDCTVAMCFTTCVALCTLYGVLHVYNTDYCWCVGLFFIYTSLISQGVYALLYFSRVCFLSCLLRRFVDGLLRY